MTVFLKTTTHVEICFGLLFQRFTYFLAILAEKVVTKKKLKFNLLFYIYQYCEYLQY